MTQETSDSKLYTLLIILSIAIVIIAAGFYSFVVAGTGVKLLNISASPEQKWLSVSGSASSYVIPDTASISLGIITRAATAKEASDKNAASMNVIISAIKDMGIPDKEIRTSFISLQPEYNYSVNGGSPAIVGYSASNNVQITTTMFEKISDLLDKSVTSGANQVSGISFMVSEEKQKQINDELLSNAVIDAQGKAARLAKNLDVRIVSVKSSSINEGAQPFPILQASSEKAAIPIQPGESRVTLSVQMTYIIE
jgi:uncharacterized protein YggE